MRSKFGVLVTATMVVGVLLLGLLLGGCSDPTSPAAVGTSTTATKPNGSLTANSVSITGQSFDPKNGGGSTYRYLVSAFLGSLVELDAKGSLKPGLAERWEISTDGLTHTFYIRKGVKFHDGSDLTGEDVKFSMERVMEPDALHNTAGIWRAQVASVELKDTFTVVLHLKVPQFELLKGLGDFTSGAGVVVPKKYIETNGIAAWQKTWVGTGPWKVANYVPGVSLTLEANENYWESTQVPKFKTINLSQITEQQTKASMLKTGELDFADVTIDGAPALKAAGLRIVAHDTGTAWAMMLFYDLANPQKYAMGDVRVRKALSLAINRQEMSDKLYAGYGMPAALAWVRPSAEFYDAKVLKPDPYDPEGAKKLLAEAGYPDGFDTKLIVNLALNEAPLATQAIGGYWGKVGVKAQIASMENTTPLFIPKQVPEIWNSSQIMPGRGPLQAEKLVTAYHSTKSAIKNINVPRLDELIDKIPLTLDPVQKNKMALEAAVLAKNEYSAIAYVYIPELWAVGSKVGDWTATDGVEGLGYAFNTITHAK